MSATASNAIIITDANTFDEAVAALSVYFGGEPVNLSSGETLRDPQAVFTGTALNKEQYNGQVSVSTGAGEPVLERDINGLPWDERIHSSTKTKNADGSWRGRKGVPPPTITKVKAELLAKYGTPSATTAAEQSATAQPSGAQNEEAARAARIAHAEKAAFDQCGPIPCDQDTFDRMRKGQVVTVPPYVNEYFMRWQTAMNNAYVAHQNDVAASAAQTAHMGLQTISPGAQTNQPVQVAQATPAADATVTTFAQFATKYAAHLANPVLAEVLATLGVQGGFGALATNEQMIPATVALLAAKGIA